MSIAAIVPAYNEEKAISDVIHNILSVAMANQLMIDIIVINDCSTDNTAMLISKLPCVAINLPINLGIGGAVQTGFRYAFINGYDFAIQIDGDGQHPAEEIPGLLNCMKANNADVVIGSRFIEKAGFQSSRSRRTGIKYFTILIKLLTGKYITDATSGYRIINRKTLKVVNEYYPDEYPEPEAIMLYARHHLKIVEAPVEMKERQGGKSSINMLSGIYYMFKVSLAVLFTFIRSRNLPRN